MSETKAKAPKRYRILKGNGGISLPGCPVDPITEEMLNDPKHGYKYAKMIANHEVSHKVSIFGVNVVME